MRQNPIHIGIGKKSLVSVESLSSEHPDLLLTQPMATGRGQGQPWVLGHHKGWGPVRTVLLVLGTRQGIMQAQGAGGKLRGQAAV